jgi:Endopolygalacturonase
MKIKMLLLACFCLIISLKAQKLVIHSVPGGFLYSRHNDDYTVQVRQKDGEWQDLFEYKVQIDLDNVQDASMVQFDFSGIVEVKVRKNNGLLQNVRIRPTTIGIQPRIHGNTFYFTLDKPQKLSIETNGDTRHNLHLFANSLETDAPDATTPNVIYFGPGIHKPKDLPGDVFVIPSNTTVYLAGGAVVQGKLLCNKVENVRICGRGIIDQPVRGVEITHSRNITIDGITVINPKHYTVYMGESRYISISNLKTFSAGGWTDGLDMMSCSDINIKDVFLRTSDDCIAIYAHRWDFYGNSRNVNVSNAILWADVAHPTMIGLHGNTTHEGDTIENISFRNVDILEHDEDDRNYQGCMSINTGDFNLVRNVRYEDVRIDNFEEGQLVNLRVYENPKYTTGAGRNIEDILFKNISYTGNNANPSIIEGFNDERRIKNVTFQNLRINGRLITDAESAGIKTGKFVNDMQFEK